MKANISPVKAALVFFVFTLYFYLLLFTLVPWLQSNYTLNPALYWFITGYFLFMPIFLVAVLMSAREGGKSLREILDSLNVRLLSKKEWAWAIAGLLACFVSTGLVFGASYALSAYCGFRPISTTPWFMEISPFHGKDALLLLVWLPMFFFNIAGEELLWRGYIQARLPGVYWPLCSLLWLMFHLPFGFELLIILVPIIVIVPYVYYKTNNTLAGVFIHGLYNGPVFVAVALGLIH